MRRPILPALILSLSVTGGAFANPPSASDTAAVEAEAERIRSFHRALTQTAGNTPTVSVQSAPAPQATEAAHHLVVEGDTLYGLSRRYGLSLSELQQANGLDGAAIALGQTLTIPQKAADPNRMVQPAAQPQTPKSAVYAVAPKDSLYAISRRTCVAVADIAAANGLSSPFILQPGQRLQLPSGHCLSR